MTNKKTSRAEYFRQRRKSSSKRGEVAKRDAERKRVKRLAQERPHPQNPRKVYEPLDGSLPRRKKIVARLLLDHPPSMDLLPGSLTPKPNLDDLRDGPFKEGGAPTMYETPLVNEDTLQSELERSKLVLKSNARQRRMESLQARLEREFVRAFERLSEHELVGWFVSRYPELDQEVLDRLRARYADARNRVDVRRRYNAEKQKSSRDQQLDSRRPKEKEKTRAKRAREKEARQRAPFVAIDAEGVNVGDPFPITATGDNLYLDLGLPEGPSDDRSLTGQDHRTFLWGARGDDGSVDWLGGNDKVLSESKNICEWLVSLPKKFPGAIFVMFGAGYDWTQIFRDMQYEKAWELWYGLPWAEHDYPTGGKTNRRRWVLWGWYGLRLYPGKYLEIAKLKDRDKIKDEKGNFNWERKSKIKIYDTLGFFQTSFMNAATGFGGDFLQRDELEILTIGKSRRHEIANTPLANIMLGEIKRYTHVELKVIARMMTTMRVGLRSIDLEPRDWHGAGCIAQAMMTKDHVTDFYPESSAAVDVDDLSDPLAWALRAYFGARIEMIKQGVREQKFFNYDISSAYPHILRQLPDMKNGKWRNLSADQLLTPGPNEQPISKFRRSQQNLRDMLERLEDMSLVSMVRVRFYFPPCRRRVFNAGQSMIARADPPWFPLPIRTDDGTIYFPRRGQGIYMVEEVRAMLRWAMQVYKDANKDERPMVELLCALEFTPANGANPARPFKTRVEKGFAERAAIIRDTENERLEWAKGGKVDPEPYDVREKVLKLGLNALYGKTAQSKGMRMIRDKDGVMRAKPPRYSNMYYAAAVTAGTRAMLLDAAKCDVDAATLFATDGICSIRPLPNLEIAATKTLGAWEESLRQRGVFVKAGIYTHEPYPDAASEQTGADNPAGKQVKRTTKMRGIRPASLPEGMTAEQWLIKEVPQAWERDEPSLRFPYRAYKTFGAALASRESWKLAGHWIEGVREADIQRVSPKRDCRGVARLRMENGGERPGERRRAIALFDTAAAENPLGLELSRPFSPDWIDGKLSKRVQAEEEQKTLECKSGFGFERDT